MTDLKKHLDSEAGKYLKDYLQSKLFKLKDLSNTPDLKSKEEMVLEIKGRIKAVKILEEILSEIMTIQGQKSGTSKDPRDKYYVGIKCK